VQLKKLRRFALQRSPFYRKFHKGLEDEPLSTLPVLTKHQLMEVYDDLVTDRAVRLADVRNHIADNTAQKLFQGRYQVCATSGTSGQPGIFLYDRREWVWILSSFARANRLAGAPAGLFHQLPFAIVGSSRRWHQSNAVAASLECRWLPGIRLSATDPLADICRNLTHWKPRLLVSYAAMSGILAEEQLAGRLDIAPEAVMCIAEMLTNAVREQILRAWGAMPFENYASTETACIAAECQQHSGLHLFDDLLIVEVVDQDHRPVSPGKMGAMVLVSVLFSRTLPLIRYEIEDAVMLSEIDCMCDLPFHRITRLGGRIAETLHIVRSDGTIATVHPTHFEDAIGLTGVRGWQVIRRHDLLSIRLLAPVSERMLRHVETNVRNLVTELGIDHLTMRLEVIDDLERAPSGKMILVHDASGR
jgi:phenylacetate-coenzyme A ligase PaaK-like adenylate-forming protein